MDGLMSQGAWRLVGLVPLVAVLDCARDSRPPPTHTPQPTTQHHDTYTSTHSHMHGPDAGDFVARVHDRGRLALRAREHNVHEVGGGRHWLEFLEIVAHHPCWGWAGCWAYRPIRSGRARWNVCAGAVMRSRASAG